MARKGDGIYLRGKTWYLDFRRKGERFTERLGKSISKTTARELATIKRSEIIKGGAGVKKKKDITFESAAEEFPVGIAK